MIENGKTVIVNYTGTFDDGTVFDSTENKGPLEYQVGSGLVIHGFDEAVRNMEVGQTVNVHVAMCDAYGPHDDSRIQERVMATIPDAQNIEIGKPFFFLENGGIPFPATVTKVVDGIATLDFNNPLAGKDLNYTIELVEVRD